MLSYDSISATAVAQALSALIFAALISRIIQSRFVHPLRSYPGPWLNSMTEWPAAIALASGRQHAYYKRLHTIYGPVVRVAPNELVFIGADAWEGIYGIRKDGPNLAKSKIYIGSVAPVAGQTGITMAGAEDHARQRRAMAHPFSNTALLQQEEIIQTHIDKLMTKLKTQAEEKQSIDISSWYTWTTFDIIGDLCFAEPFNCLEGGAAADWSDALIHAFGVAGWEQAIRRVAGIDTALQRLLSRLLVPRRFVEWRRMHMMNSRAKTLSRLADENRDHKDFIYHILQSSEAKRLLSETEIILNSAIIVIAGSETTATTLAGWTYFMGTHPDIYARLVAEVRGAFEGMGDRDITWATTKDLHYLNACVNETMRLYGPVTASMQRVVPEGGAVIDGHFVPVGTTVGVAPWAATHLPQNFSDPETFDPERWLHPEMFPNDKLHGSQPFSVGPRGCIGKNLAWIELRLVIAHLLWNFDVELDGEETRNTVWDREGDMRNMKGYITWIKPALWVRLTRVQR